MYKLLVVLGVLQIVFACAAAVAFVLAGPELGWPLWTVLPMAVATLLGGISWGALLLSVGRILIRVDPTAAPERLPADEQIMRFARAGKYDVVHNRLMDMSPEQLDRLAERVAGSEEYAELAEQIEEVRQGRRPRGG